MAATALPLAAILSTSRTVVLAAAWGYIQCKAKGVPHGSCRDTGDFLEAFLISTGVVALGEMGDKTQLLALLLAARFK
ncbi:MAG: TMEM165/GDT1 family protein, partial [Burkholderiaceae bacterium]